MARFSMRPATPEDREWLYVLHEAAMRERSERENGPWESASQRERFFARGERDVRIVEIDAERIGAVHLDEDPDGSLRIGLIEIHPDRQRQGLGAQVIRALDEEASRAGADLTLRVRHGNDAVRLYQRLGFVVEATDETHLHMRRR